MCVGVCVCVYVLGFAEVSGSVLHPEISCSFLSTGIMVMIASHTHAHLWLAVRHLKSARIYITIPTKDLVKMTSGKEIMLKC